MQGYGRHFSILLCVLVGLWGLPPTSSYASCEVHTGTDTFTNNTTLGQDICDASGNKKVTLGTTLAGEDTLVGVMKVETRFLTIPSGGTTARISTDQLYKTGAGLLESITCNSDATATAGTIAVLDNTAAGAGNVLYQLNVEAVAYTTPFTVPLHTPFSIGLYLDFTTTADMFCTLVYR